MPCGASVLCKHESLSPVCGVTSLSPVCGVTSITGFGFPGSPLKGVSVWLEGQAEARLREAGRRKRGTPLSTQARICGMRVDPRRGQPTTRACSGVTLSQRPMPRLLDQRPVLCCGRSLGKLRQGSTRPGADRRPPGVLQLPRGAGYVRGSGTGDRLLPVDSWARAGHPQTQHAVAGMG